MLLASYSGAPESTVLPQKWVNAWRVTERFRRAHDLTHRIAHKRMVAGICPKGSEVGPFRHRGREKNVSCFPVQSALAQVFSVEPEQVERVEQRFRLPIQKLVESTDTILVEADNLAVQNRVIVWKSCEGGFPETRT